MTAKQFVKSIMSQAEAIRKENYYFVKVNFMRFPEAKTEAKAWANAKSIIQKTEKIL